MAKKTKDISVVDDSVDAIIEDDQAENSEPIENARDEQLGDHRPFKQKLLGALKSGPGMTVLLLAVIAGVVLAVPMTRYAALGFFVKKQVAITVVDEQTGKPVTDASVRYWRADVKTDSKGVARLSDVPVGDHPLAVEKKYYNTYSSSYTAPITGSAAMTLKLKATGRLATVTVKNAISGKLLEGANVKVGDTAALTDDKGVASVALGVKDADQTGQVELKGYRQAAVSVNTKDMAPVVDVALVPEGNVYFLSNRTGAYDVMSSTLDGTDQQVVVKGTGKEVAYELQLYPSPDSSKLAYIARRDNDGTPSIYVITIADGRVTKLDNTNSAEFIGWIGDTLHFSLSNYNMGAPIDQRRQLWSYNTSTKQRVMIDHSSLTSTPTSYGELDLSTRFQLVGDRVYYAKCWNAYSNLPNKTAQLMAVVNGKATSLKEVQQDTGAYCDTVATKPGIVYYRVTYPNGDSDSYRYQLGKSVESVQVNDAELYNTNYTYYASPDGEKTLWSEVRDGKQVTFIGDANGQNETQVSGSQYTAKGWLGDNYVLYSKGGSELFVAAAGAQFDGSHKIADYYSQRGID